MTISTLNSWLPGDPRGWRSRGHKKHSSGDYKARPPRGEHAGLHAHVKESAGDAVIIEPHLRQCIGSALRASLSDDGHRVLCIALAETHAHVLVELPVEPAEVRRIIGAAKNQSSRAVRREMPGRIWAAGGDYKPVKTHEHHRRVYRYIVAHGAEGAWVWTYRDGG